MTLFSTCSFAKGDNILHVGTYSSFRMASFLSGCNQRIVDGYPGSTWAALMNAQALRVVVGGR